MREIHSKFFQWRKRQNSVGCAPDEEEEGKKKGKVRTAVRKKGWERRGEDILHITMFVVITHARLAIFMCLLFIRC